MVSREIQVPAHEIEDWRRVFLENGSRGLKRAGKNRVLRLKREHGLLAPTREGSPHGDPTHGGTIRTERPDELWGTDATRFPTRKNGWCWFFGAIDHCTNEVVGWHVAQKGDRWAALEPIRQGVLRRFVGYEAKIARGLGRRHDWGPQYTAHRFTGELRWLGIRSSPTYVGEPEGNRVMERWLRTLKEECLYLHDFESLEEARSVIRAFLERYNREWLIERHGHRTQTEAHRHHSERAA